MTTPGRSLIMGARSAVVVLMAGASAWSVLPAKAETFDCIMEPAQKVKVGSPVTGILAKVEVERGDEIKAGQIIAKLDTTV